MPRATWSSNCARGWRSTRETQAIMINEWERRPEGERAFYRELVGPLRMVGWALRVLAAVFAIAIIFIALQNQQFPPTGILLIPIVIFALGELFFFAVRCIQRQTIPQLPTLACWAFIGAGAAMIIGGLLGGISEPDMFWLAAFGLPFVGIGYLAHKLFVVPKGKKAVTIGAHTVPGRNYWGQATTISQGQIIYVDENADESAVETEIATVKQQQVQQLWQERADWAAGRIEQESLQHRGGKLAATVLYSGLGIGLLILAVWLRDGFWIFAALLGCSVATALVVHQIRETLRNRRFGSGYLILESTPVFLGDTLQATVQTGVQQQERPHDGFTLTLECVHRWQERVDSAHDDDADRDRTEYHRDVLWSASMQTYGEAYDSNPVCLAASVRFDLPAEQPATTLGGTGEGISWELKIEAALKGIDYSADFKLPVFAREDEALFADLPSALTETVTQ